MLPPACSGPHAMSEAWVSVDEISRHLRVVKDTIYRWIENRGLPAHCVGKLWKFKLSEVDGWVKRGEVGDQLRGGSLPTEGGLA
ncbi:MAG TPA: helix-turn-helix domain-containing protein [Burkholderiales bacterium]|nr:helix-turn-helix domain-containing protein [Burkholderiales bacterium]